MAPLSLNSLPVEVIEAIVNLLDFQDICALRLTARNVSSKSSNGTFRTYFTSKKLQITRAPLEQFVRVTQSGQLGRLLQRLTLYDNAVSETGDSHADFDAAKLLAQGMENMRNQAPHGCLLSLSLSLNGIEHATPEENRDAAANLFQVAMSALGSSILPVRSLDTFADFCRHGYYSRCSLACGEITAALSKADFSTSFKQCTKLCLSLSHCLRDIDQEEWRSPLSFDEARRHTRSICDFVNLFSKLEELHLVWEYEDLEETDAIVEEMHFFNRVAVSCEFPCLKKCTLQNIRTSETALLSFFQKVQLVHLSMEIIYLDGEFDSLFHCLSTSMPDLDYLHLQQLYPDSGTLYFPGEPSFAKGRRKMGPLALTRTGPNARRLVIPSRGI